MTATVREIVRKYLEREGYDGLFNEVGECACLRDDLAPCGSMNELCEEGYRVECAGCESGDKPHWHIVGKNPVAPCEFIVGERYVFVREEPAVFEMPPNGSIIRNTTIVPSAFIISQGAWLLCEANMDGFIDMAHGDLRYRLSIAEYGSCFALVEKK